MNTCTRSLLRTAGVIAAGSLCIGNIASAQEATGDIAKWRFGLLGGAGYNYVETSMQRFVGAGADPLFQGRDYSEASEITPYAGINAEYIFNTLLGVNLRVTYDDRAVSKEVRGATFTPYLSFISIEPAVRLNLYDGLHFNIGPSVSFPIRHVYDYTPATGEAGRTVDNAELENVRDLSAGAWGGFAYDIALNSGPGALRWYLTPFVEGSWMYDQKKSDAAQSNFDEKWTTLTGRTGIQVKLGPAPEVKKVVDVTPMEPSMNISVRPPRTGVLQPRDLIEQIPLMNYMFFDKDSSGIPARYARLQPESVPGFDERKLAQTITTGSTKTRAPEERQMQVYHNMLNIFGDRLAKTPGAMITLVGSAPDQKEGLAMAENVKRYMVNTFGIRADRIAVKGQARPPHASGTRATPKEDLPLVVEENRRVEILSDNMELLEPVKLRTEMKGAVMNYMDIEVDSPDEINSWTITVAGEGFDRTYGPFHSGIQRINATPILAGNTQGTYKATVNATLENGASLTRETTFRLNRTERPAMTANRYSILFDYDESKTVELYEQFLRRTVAPALPKGSLVYVHGHTDMIGDADHNADLSMDRASTAMRILEDETARLGINVIFDAYGYGEDIDEAPFANGSPEGRHYNRTVVIDVIEGM